MNVYVKNLPPEMDEEGLQNEFQACGEITSVRVMRDNRGQSKRFGFVMFSTHEEAENAIRLKHGIHSELKQSLFP